MKILKLQAENFKKLKVVEITPQNNVIEITGKCEQGKTTILDAIQTALCGKKWDDPIREGQEKGKIVVDLGDKVVTRTFTPSGSTVKVESKDGAKYPSPQALLDGIVGKIAFNPLEFAKADSKKQVDMLLGVIDLKVDSERLKDISGVAVEVMPNPLEMLNVAYKAVFDNRTVVNRQLDAAKKSLDSLPVVPETKAVSLAELVAEKTRLEVINRDNESVRNSLKAQGVVLNALYATSQNIIGRIAELEVQLDTERKKLREQNDLISDNEAQLTKLKNEADALQDEDLADITDRIAKADETNKKAQQYADREAKKADVSKHQAESDDYTNKLEAIKKYKTELIANTKMPVPGLDFAGGGLTLNGKPFPSQASGSERIKVGIAIGMATNPDLRVIMLDGYESLDPDQKKIVEEMAVANDFQVWTTAVDASGKVGIYIEDGEIKAVGGQQ